MKTIDDFIIEKLKLNKETSIGISEFDGTNAKLIEDILKSTFIYIYRDRVYKIAGISRYVIKKSEVNYEEIIKILNSEYNYAFDTEENKNKKTEINTFIRKHLDTVQTLINMKSVKFHASNSNNWVTLNGKNIYWDDWKEYKLKYNLTKY